MVKLSEVKVGQEFVDVVKNITREQITKYGNASGDRNPIHMDEKFATDVAGLKGVIAHGLLWMGFVGKFLTQLVDNGKIIKWGGQFRGQVRPGDDVETKVKVTKIEGNKVSVEINQFSSTPIKVEKGGQVVKKFEAEEKGWVDEKDVKEGNIKTKEVPEGTLTYRYRLSFPGTAILELAN
ncbi:MAG: hypothetical protein RBG13Loki_0083 [Promethearchaeota archaeon CR_4]|nr:MAG: hypothetical protein RBG13Loki_0083 [Candidatus Lokiarchaeota archaeon CR_4]